MFRVKVRHKRARRVERVISFSGDRISVELTATFEWLLSPFLVSSIQYRPPIVSAVSSLFSTSSPISHPCCKSRRTSFASESLLASLLPFIIHTRIRRTCSSSLSFVPLQNIAGPILPRLLLLWETAPTLPRARLTIAPAHHPFSLLLSVRTATGFLSKDINRRPLRLSLSLLLSSLRLVPAAMRTSQRRASYLSRVTAWTLIPMTTTTLALASQRPVPSPPQATSGGHFAA